MNKSIKDALILCLITLVAGLLLGGVFELTKTARLEQQIKTQNNAYKTVSPNATSFDEITLNTGSISEVLSANDISEKSVVVNGAVYAKNGDEIVGYIVNVTSKEGFGGDIAFSVGVDLNGKVTGISILSISETAGLGMNAKNEDYLNQYMVDRNGLYIVNKDDKAEGTNIDAISGATITSKAVTKGVNAAILVAELINTGKGAE